MSHKISTTSQNHNNNSSGLFNNLNLGLRRLFKLPLDFYSCMVSSGKLSLRRSRTLQISALVSSFALILTISATLAPLYNKTDITEAATGTAKESSLSLNVTNSTASVDLGVVKDNGSFASSTSPMAFNITTTNYTGYTLSLKNTKSTKTLVNSTNGNYTLDSITSSVTESAFSADTTSAATNYNGKWGYKPSKYNSSSNSNYLSLPTTSGSTLDTTTAANSSANSYTISIGARASYTQPAGTYTGTYTLTAVGNAITYYLSFTDNTSDSTVSGLPNAMSSSISTTSVTLPTTTPTRTGYTFKSWCLGTVSNSGTTCTGTEYAKGATFGIDQTSSNGNTTTPVTLYALWTVNSNNVTLTRGSNITNITLGSGGGTTNSSTTSSFNYGSTVTMSATKASNTTCITYGTPSWSVTSGGVSLSTASGTSTSFTMPNNAVAVTVSSTSTRNPYTITYNANGGTGTMSSTSAYCGQAVTLRANTFTRSGYAFLGWSTSSSATTATYTDKQSITLNQTSTLTLYAVWKAATIDDITYMQDVTASMVSSMTANQTATLTDKRDGQIYTTAKIGNLLWMTRNLAIGCAGSGSTYSATIKSVSLTSSDSNVSSTWATPTALLSAKASSSSTSGYTTAAMECNASYGGYYNYAAATAGTITGASNSTGASYSVCPSGWKLPTNAEQATIGNSAGDATYVSTFSPTTGGYYSDGALNTGRGQWWSSTANDTTYRYYLCYLFGKLYSSSGYKDRRFLGNAVRCIRAAS